MIQFSQQASLAGAVTVTVSANWAGTLRSAIVGGKLKVNTFGAIGDERGKLSLNGTEIGPAWDMVGVSFGYAEGSFSIDITDALQKGANQFTFFVYPAWGIIAITWIAVDGTLTLTAESVTIVTGGPGQSWTDWWNDLWKTSGELIPTIAVIALVVAFVIVYAFIARRK